MCPHLVEVPAPDGGALGAVLARRIRAPSLLLVRRLGEPRGTWVVNDPGGGEAPDLLPSRGGAASSKSWAFSTNPQEGLLCSFAELRKKPLAGLGPLGGEMGKAVIHHLFTPL